MSIPIWMLLGFAAWTVILLLSTIGVYRWSRILTGQTPIKEFRADQIEGADWYRRSMRAHANCIENLPVFGSIVFALYVSQLSDATVSYLCVTVLVARVMQSLVHVCLPQTNTVAAIRFVFFFVQIVCFVTLIVMIVRHAAPMA
jgi:uncharacterized MAPEG superfamily protein